MGEDSQFPKPIRLIVEIVVALGALGTTITGWVQLAGGHAEAVWVGFLVVGIAGLWFWLLHVVRSKRQKKGKKPSFVFPQRIRWWARLGLFVVPVLVLLGVVIAYYLKMRPKYAYGDIVVVVAQFPGPDPEKWAVNNFLLENLNATAKEWDRLRIVPSQKSVTPADAEVAAKQLAVDEQAQIVVWGWYAANGPKIDVTYHIFDMQRWNYFEQSIVQQDISYSWYANVEQASVFPYPSAALADNIQTDLLKTISLEFASRKNFEPAIEVNAINLRHIEKNRSSYANYDEARSWVLSMQGTMHVANGQTSLGLQEATQATDAYPSTDAYANLGTAYNMLADYPNAIRAYKKSIELGASGMSPFMELGHIYIKKTDNQAAVDVLTQGIEGMSVCQVDNGCGMLHYERGIAYANLKKIEDAKSDFEIVAGLAHDPAVSEYLDRLLNEGQ